MRLDKTINEAGNNSVEATSAYATESVKCVPTYKKNNTESLTLPASLEMLKTLLAKIGEKKIALGFDLGDVLGFQDILYPSKFGCLAAKGSFSTPRS